MSSSTFSWAFLQRMLTQYGMYTYLILGDIGLVLNMLIFSQRIHRRNPCSLYILFTSISGFIGLNSAIIPNLYALSYRSLLIRSVFLCRLFYYLRHSFSQMMRTFIVLACIDRYINCQDRNHLRRIFNQYRITIRIILSVIVFWLLLGLFPSSLQVIENGVCDVFDPIHSIMFSTYVILVLGVLPLTGMLVFSSLIMINLRRIRARVQPRSSRGSSLSTNILRKRDREMIRMILVEITFYIVTATPLTIVLIYRAVTQSMIKSQERQNIETFFTYLTRSFLLYLNNSLSFWIYICSSYSFRLEVKSLLITSYQRIFFQTDRRQSMSVHTRTRHRW